MPTLIEIIGAALFGVAVLHTFSTKAFERLAHVRPQHAGLFHLLGEVEVVFGFWAMVLMALMLGVMGHDATIHYIDTRNFTEPMFVFAIMVIAGSRPIGHLALTGVQLVARALPFLPGSMAFYIVALSVVPLLGSFITEPAAMTLAAVLLRDRVYHQPLQPLSTRLKYATLGVLFVNVSIGGLLTPYAAPPVLMVAKAWGWDLSFMLVTFGWKVALAVSLNAVAAAVLFRHELAAMRPPEPSVQSSQFQHGMPWIVPAVHALLLAGVVVFSHHPAIFMGLLLFFLGFAQAYARYQDRLILREGLLVAFFLAGLVVLGGQQQWWLEALLGRMDAQGVYIGATLLTAITDNAALTYLGSLVPGLSLDFKIALVAGAVTGGGLTVIANAPNPAGFAILRDRFDDGAIHPLGLLLAALPPTLMAVVAFRGL